MNKADLLKFSNVHKLFRPFYAGIGHALMFHRVSKEEHSALRKNLQVSPEYLERVIKYFISKDIDIITLDEMHTRITSQGKVKRFVVFTFDDGYEDNYTEALPVFEKYNAPFTLFLTTSFPDHQIVLWGYLLEDLVMDNDRIEFSDGDASFAYNTLSFEQKSEAFSEIRKYIMDSSQHELLPRLENIFKKDSDALYDLTKRMALSWEQVKELGNHSLVTLGAHTINHLSLSKLSKEEAMEEICGSMKIIERKTGKPVKYFAYPFGIPSTTGSREFKIASDCNVSLAFTTDSSNILKHHAKQLHSLPRIELTEGWRNTHLDLYINGLTPFVHKLIR